MSPVTGLILGEMFIMQIKAFNHLPLGAPADPSGVPGPQLGSSRSLLLGNLLRGASEGSQSPC